MTENKLFISNKKVHKQILNDRYNHKGRGNGIWCNGAYVNRKFIIASKYCIDKIPESDLSVFNHYECNSKTNGKSVLKVHELEDWALLEMPKAPFISYGGSNGTFYNAPSTKKFPHFEMKIVLISDKNIFKEFKSQRNQLEEGRIA